MSSVRCGRGRQVRAVGWAEHGRPHCCSQGFALCPRGQVSHGQAYPGSRWYDLHLRQLPPASAWHVVGGRVEGGTWGKREESRMRETDDERLASRKIYSSEMKGSEKNEALQKLL